MDEKLKSQIKIEADNSLPDPVALITFSQTGQPDLLLTLNAPMLHSLIERLQSAERVLTTPPAD